MSCCCRDNGGGLCQYSRLGSRKGLLLEPNSDQGVHAIAQRQFRQSAHLWKTLQLLWNRMYVEGLLVELTVLRSAGGRPYGACAATTDFNNALGMSVLGSFVCGFTEPELLERPAQASSSRDRPTRSCRSRRRVLVSSKTTSLDVPEGGQRTSSKM
jgi:hypothetical protein